MATKYLSVYLALLVFSAMTIHQPFYIYFERSGGFAGITNTLEIQSDSLSQDEFDQISRLVKTSGFFDIDESYTIKGNMPDQFHYKITIEHKDQRQTLELGDAVVPDSLRPLIQYLSQKARKVKK